MISRCNRYNLSEGWWPFTCVCTRWMVNVKPRVSLAWPPRCSDHNALVLSFPGGPQPWRPHLLRCFLAAPPSFTLACPSVARLFPLNKPPGFSTFLPLPIADCYPSARRAPDTPPLPRLALSAPHARGWSSDFLTLSLRRFREGYRSPQLRMVSVMFPTGSGKVSAAL